MDFFFFFFLEESRGDTKIIIESLKDVGCKHQRYLVEHQNRCTLTLINQNYLLYQNENTPDG